MSGPGMMGRWATQMRHMKVERRKEKYGSRERGEAGHERYDDHGEEQKDGEKGKGSGEKKKDGGLNIYIQVAVAVLLIYIVLSSLH